MGATFPGRESAQITRTPRFFAISKSTPPGFEARSITSESVLIFDSSLSPRTSAGIVLKIISNSPSLAFPLS